MDDNSTVCQTCLSTDRQLHPLEEIKDLLEGLGIEVQIYGQICWECQRSLRNFARFKRQIDYAQKILKCKTNSNFKPLSRLSYCKKFYYYSNFDVTSSDITCNEAGPILIKQEASYGAECKVKRGNGNKGNAVFNENDTIEIADENLSELPKITCIESITDQSKPPSEDEVCTDIIELNIPIHIPSSEDPIQNNLTNKENFVQHHYDQSPSKTVDAYVESHNLKNNYERRGDANEYLEQSPTDTHPFLEHSYAKNWTFNSKYVESRSNAIVSSKGHEIDKQSKYKENVTNDYPVASQSKSKDNFEDEDDNDNISALLQAIDRLTNTTDPMKDLEAVENASNKDKDKQKEYEIDESRNNVDANKEESLKNKEGESVTNKETIIVRVKYIANPHLNLVRVKEEPLSDNEEVNDHDNSLNTPNEALSLTAKQELLNPDSDEEFRVWKRSIILVYNRLRDHKYASRFSTPVTDAQAPEYSRIVKRPMDLSTIWKNIRDGNIRTTAEFQRDLLLMLTNALMYNSSDHAMYEMTRDLFEETKYQLDVFLSVHALKDLPTDTPQRPKRRAAYVKESPAKVSRSFTIDSNSIDNRKIPKGQTKTKITGKNIHVNDKRINVNTNEDINNIIFKAPKPKDKINVDRIDYAVANSLLVPKARRNSKAFKSSILQLVIPKLELKSNERCKVDKVSEVDDKVKRKCKKQVKVEKDNSYTNNKNIFNNEPPRRSARARVIKTFMASCCGPSGCCDNKKKCKGDVNKVQCETKIYANNEVGNKTCNSSIEKVQSDTKRHVSNKDSKNKHKDSVEIEQFDTTSCDLDIDFDRATAALIQALNTIDDKEHGKKYSKLGRKAKNKYITAFECTETPEKEKTQSKRGRKRKYTITEHNSFNITLATTKILGEEKQSKRSRKTKTEFDSFQTVEQEIKPSKRGRKRKNKTNTEQDFTKLLPTIKVEKPEKITPSKRGRKRKTNIEFKNVTEQLSMKPVVALEPIDMSIVKIERTDDAKKKIIIVSPKVEKDYSKNFTNFAKATKDMDTIKPKNYLVKATKELNSEKPKNYLNKATTEPYRIKSINDLAEATKLDIKKTEHGLSKELNNEKPKNYLAKTTNELDSKTTKNDLAKATKELDSEKPKNDLAKATKELVSEKTKDGLSKTNEELDVVVTKPNRNLTIDEANKIKRVLEDEILSIALVKGTFAPKFKSEPILADGVLKLWCEDFKTLDWLKKTINDLPGYLGQFLIKTQSEIPKKVKAEILVPGFHDVTIVLRLLSVQNSWAEVGYWILHKSELRGESLHLTVTVPENILNQGLRKLACGLGSVEIKVIES